MSLSEVESFIKKNGHLPGVTSYEETQEQGGILVNKVPYENLEKVEELYIHVIELKKENDEMKKQNTALKSELDLLKERLDALESK